MKARDLTSNIIKSNILIIFTFNKMLFNFTSIFLDFTFMLKVHFFDCLVNT
jgi:hypothetical protein